MKYLYLKSASYCQGLILMLKQLQFGIMVVTMTATVSMSAE